MTRRVLLFATAIFFSHVSVGAQTTPAVPERQHFPSPRRYGKSSTFFYNGARQRLYTNIIGMAFVEVPEGSFVMSHYQPGCPDPDPKIPQPEPEFFLPRQLAEPPPRPWNAADVPQPASADGSAIKPEDTHWTPAQYVLCRKLAKRDSRVGFIANVPDAFLMGATEVTQAQWRRVMGNNPSYFQGARVDGPSDDYPVDSVSWQDAKTFVRKLNEMEGAENYRLPTEVEWEWAARAGLEYSGRWTMLDNSTAAYGWFTGDGVKLETHHVALKKPNAWNLYDMLGNVNEWVEDFDNGNHLASPIPPKRGKVHVLKGGSFMADAHSQTVFDHFRGPGSVRDVGFRIARRLVP